MLGGSGATVVVVLCGVVMTTVMRGCVSATGLLETLGGEEVFIPNNPRKNKNTGMTKYCFMFCLLFHWADTASVWNE